MIAGFKYYCVSKLGEVFSCRYGGCRLRITNWRKIAIRIGKKFGSRAEVCLSKGDIKRNHKVAHLVLKAFVGPRPKGKECCHNDGNQSNNALSNLRWDTHVNNMKDQIAHGTASIGERHGMAKLTKADVLVIRAIANNVTNQKIGERFKITGGQAWRIRSRLSWKSL
jgi:hypothetical protein